MVVNWATLAIIFLGIIVLKRKQGEVQNKSTPTTSYPLTNVRPVVTEEVVNENMSVMDYINKNYSG